LKVCLRPVQPLEGLSKVFKNPFKGLKKTVSEPLKGKGSFKGLLKALNKSCEDDVKDLKKTL
jgi:hypothetical protein